MKKTRGIEIFFVSAKRCSKRRRLSFTGIVRFGPYATTGKVDFLQHKAKDFAII